MTCNKCGGTGEHYDALWRLVQCDCKRRRICSACKGTGDGGRDSEGAVLPCEPCAGNGSFRVRRDPPLYRETIEVRV